MLRLETSHLPFYIPMALVSLSVPQAPGSVVFIAVLQYRYLPDKSGFTESIAQQTVGLEAVRKV